MTYTCEHIDEQDSVQPAWPVLDTLAGSCDKALEAFAIGPCLTIDPTPLEAKWAWPLLPPAHQRPWSPCGKDSRWRVWIRLEK